MSSIVSPDAKKSKIKDTQIRVPLIQGLPKQIFGLTEMRSNNLLFSIFINFYKTTTFLS